MSKNAAHSKTFGYSYHSDRAFEIGTRTDRFFQKVLPTFSMNYDSSGYVDLYIGI